MMFEKRLDDLMKFAVIECESVDPSGSYKRLKVGPIIYDYIQQKISSNFKLREISIMMVCTHLRDKLYEWKKEYSDKVVNCKSLKEYQALQDGLSENIKKYEH